MNKSTIDICKEEASKLLKLQCNINKGNVSPNKKERCFDKIIKDYYDKYLATDQSHNYIEDFNTYLYLIDPTPDRAYYNYYLTTSLTESFKKHHYRESFKKLLDEEKNETGKKVEEALLKSNKGIIINFNPKYYLRDLKEYYIKMKDKAILTNEKQIAIFNAFIIEIDPKNIISYDDLHNLYNNGKLENFK